MGKRTIDITDPEHHAHEAMQALKTLLLARLAEAERDEVLAMSAADIAEAEFRSPPTPGSLDPLLRRGSQDRLLHAAAATRPRAIPRPTISAPAAATAIAPATTSPGPYPPNPSRSQPSSAGPKAEVSWMAVAAAP